MKRNFIILVIIVLVMFSTMGFASNDINIKVDQRLVAFTENTGNPFLLVRRFRGILSLWVKMSWGLIEKQ
jgi:hypothetical protein